MISVLRLDETAPWTILLIGTGISKQVTENTVLRTTKVYTRPYCAPEMRNFARDRCETDSYTYTNAVDIWSIGIVCFELLTGKRPFDDRKILMDYYDGKVEFSPETAKIFHLSQDCLGFLSAVLANKPRKRPDAAKALQLEWLKISGNSQEHTVDIDEITHGIELTTSSTAPLSGSTEVGDLKTNVTEEELKTISEIITSKFGLEEKRSNPRSSGKLPQDSSRDTVPQNTHIQNPKAILADEGQDLKGNLESGVNLGGNQSSANASEKAVMMPPTNIQQSDIDSETTLRPNAKARYQKPYVEDEIDELPKEEGSGGQGGWGFDSNTCKEWVFASDGHETNSPTREPSPPLNPASGFSPVNEAVKEKIDTQPNRPSYIKINRKHLDIETLDFYKIPWEYDRVSLKFRVCTNESCLLMKQRRTLITFVSSARPTSCQLIKPTLSLSIPVAGVLRNKTLL